MLKYFVIGSKTELPCGNILLFLQKKDDKVKAIRQDPYECFDKRKKKQKKKRAST